MNRDIKFRVWDGHGSMFHQIPDTVEDHGFIFVIKGEENLPASEQTWYPFGLVMAEQAWIKMQYTGLKDKNGKEIYEGDVVEAKSWTPARYIVQFIEGGFCLTNPKMKGHPIDINLMYPSTGCQFSVIGNIYEHGNLLEK